MKQPAMFKVRPAPGRRVRDPLTFHVLPPEGQLKPMTNYWLRRVKDLDVEVMADEAPARKPSPPKFQPKPESKE